MESSCRLPLHVCHVKKTEMVINRLHIFLHGIALLALFYYRITTLSLIIKTREIPLLPYLIVIVSEIVLTFLWVMHQLATQWRPVKRTVYPERLPEDDKLPPIDVFIFTAHPSQEPSLEVMNTVISAMSLDYPPDKLAVYLSDDGGSYVTLYAVREAWKFARFWIPFCRKYELRIRCPESYFSADEESADDKLTCCSEFAADRKIIEKKYAEFQEALEKNSVNANASYSRNHPSRIEVIRDENTDSDPDQKEMPLLVYVAREKRPDHHHHFKAGALNVMLRVSALISNAPYFLVLDCDMYCYDPSSARQAMCLFLDPETSPQIGWVQFPQKFHNIISEHDIYDSGHNSDWRGLQGVDGLRGPMMCGSNFFMRREAIYGTDRIQKDIDLKQLKKSFGSSNEFIRSIYKPLLPEDRQNSAEALQNELQLVSSCSYDNDTEWGKEVGYIYNTVSEDMVTSLVLHCRGWRSAYVDPARPCFLGVCPTNLNDMLVQQTRWALGAMQIALSRFSPLVYGALRMSILQSMFYAQVGSLYVVPVCGLAIMPQICLLYGIPLYPKVSDPFFILFAFIFISSQLKHVQEVISYGDSFKNVLIELRVWMMRSGASYVYAFLEAIMEWIGLHKTHFVLTGKVVDKEQAKRYEQGIYDFQASPQLLVPMCSLYIFNLATFIIGIPMIFHKGDELLAQAVLPFFGIIVNYHLLEGMVFRQDSGCIAPSVTLLSVAISAVIFCCGSLLLLY
ncbi:Cellulose synthase-like protein G3 [Sesamum alatum]|uniref:Cellulose synthase-like protein G3 n=1 Tax=Sesamum alatum TaxID=300844 RepID=A0AAE2CKI5_9LAMI|nr:Cellulose synthase-like protein G3 [Sesamum alatum]